MNSNPDTRWIISQIYFLLKSTVRKGAKINVKEAGLVQSEKNHLVYKRKYHCAADRLFDWFGFNQMSKPVRYF